MTYTYAELEVSAAAHDEIKRKLTAAGYEQAFHGGRGDLIDMHGIALSRAPDSAPPEDALVRALACVIDQDSPPGLAATVLAREVLALLRGRDGIECAMIGRALLELGERFRREEPESP